MIDLWAKEITPTTELQEAYHSGQIAWPEFETKYYAELEGNPALDGFIDTIKAKDTVTLLFAGKDTEHTHVLVIVDVLRYKMQ